ncbi:uncharacterized protein LOC133188616 [Saccostrea echinata]|uniref:uncharacterized protein LOC133188616 n=1 Tax=Saccostrea echinata TaxID=191078 RepID=UPI002A80B5E7|nr:uncharacterized protein LOC133188616 [Saccostrea echinata]
MDTYKFVLMILIFGFIYLFPITDAYETCNSDSQCPSSYHCCTGTIYCCPSGTVCTGTIKCRSLWSIVGPIIGAVVLFLSIIGCCKRCCYQKSQEPPPPVVYGQQQPEVAIAQETYGQPQAYGQPPTYEQGYGQPQTNGQGYGTPGALPQDTTDYKVKL